MKPLYLPVLILFLLTSGCETAIQPPTPQAGRVEISTATPQPVIITATAPSSETPDANNAETVFRDDFNSDLEPGWQWLNENPAAWNLVQFPGFLQIHAESGYINLGTAKNVLVRNAPEGDFIVEASLNYSPDDSDQFAGIVLLESTRDYLQVGLGYCPPVVGCPGPGFYVDIYKNGKFTLPRNSMSFTENALVIRVIVQAGTISVFTSPNGAVWYRSFQGPVDIKVVQVGLFAGQNNEVLTIPAMFDYFELKIPK
ncbi:MAG: hypothetical protein Q8L87_19380 [Anaerolineales bacterium]|nr:hypothetical protein [Anaerolineales bacterium]